MQFHDRLGYIQNFACAFIGVMHLMVTAPLIWNKATERCDIAERLVRGVVAVVTDSMTAYYLMYWAIAIVAVTTEHYSFYSLHLLDIIIRKETVRNVVYAVYIPRFQLAWTLLLTGIVLYVFASFTFGWAWLRDSVPDECDTLFGCWLVVVNQGLRMGGGIGDYLGGGEPPSITEEKTTWISRTVWDVVFFLFVTVILLNVVFGIIIDQFGELRDQKKDKDDNKASMCFICGLTKDELKAGGVDFSHHVDAEHHMWNYVFYLMHVKTTPIDARNGVETYVARLLAESSEGEPDISWLPLDQCLALNEGGDDESDRRNQGALAFKELRRELRELRAQNTDLLRAQGKLLKAQENLEAQTSALESRVGEVAEQQRRTGRQWVDRWFDDGAPKFSST